MRLAGFILGFVVAFTIANVAPGLPDYVYPVFGFCLPLLGYLIGDAADAGETP